MTKVGERPECVRYECARTALEMTMNKGDRFQVTLDVAVVQLNNGRARLQFKTDSGTIVRFWYGVESLPLTRNLRNYDPHAPHGVLEASAGP
jgi:hypothetical protein